MKHHSLV